MECALIGCGRIADEIHVDALRHLPGVRIGAVCDTNAERLSAFADRWGIARRYPTVDALLRAESDLGFACVATPGFTHHSICRTLLDYRVPIFVEKPVALTLDETLDLRARAAEAGVPVCVGQSYRFRDSVMSMLAARRGGRLDWLDQCTCVHHSGPLDTDQVPWIGEERRHKVLLYEMTIHFLDLAVLFLGPARRVAAVRTTLTEDGRVTQSIHALIEHERGGRTIADLRLFASAPFTRVELFGQPSDAVLSFYPEHGSVRRGPTTPLIDLVYDVGRLSRLSMATLTEQLRKRDIRRRTRPHYRLLSRFLRHLHDDAFPNPVSLESVVPTMHLLELVGEHVYD